MKKEKTKSAKKMEEKTKIVGTEDCKDIDCYIHGNLNPRGRTFEGKVIKKFPKRVVIEFERTKLIRKYERFTKLRTKLHARLPVCMEKEIQVGDLIKIQECRPLSKIIHATVLNKVEKKLKENKK